MISAGAHVGLSDCAYAAAVSREVAAVGEDLGG